MGRNRWGRQHRLAGGVQWTSWRNKEVPQHTIAAEWWLIHQCLLSTFWRSSVCDKETHKEVKTTNWLRNCRISRTWLLCREDRTSSRVQWQTIDSTSLLRFGEKTTSAEWLVTGKIALTIDNWSKTSSLLSPRLNIAADEQLCSSKVQLVYAKQTHSNKTCLQYLLTCWSGSCSSRQTVSREACRVPSHEPRNETAFTARVFKLLRTVTCRNSEAGTLCQCVGGGWSRDAT